MLDVPGGRPQCGATLPAGAACTSRWCSRRRRRVRPPGRWRSRRTAGSRSPNSPVTFPAQWRPSDPGRWIRPGHARAPVTKPHADVHTENTASVNPRVSSRACLAGRTRSTSRSSRPRPAGRLALRRLLKRDLRRHRPVPAAYDRAGGRQERKAVGHGCSRHAVVGAFRHGGLRRSLSWELELDAAPGNPRAASF